MDSEITFTSDGLTLAGSLHVPDGRAADQKLPAVIVLHGFIGAKDNSYSEVVSRLMESWGYVVLRIDFRGCGKSEGKRGYVLCHDQVADTRNAMTWLAERPEVDPARIAVLGHSFGAAIAAYTASTDTRFAAAIISCGWGHGERKFRGQHPTPEAWEKFTGLLAEGRAHKARTGETLMVSRWDVVPMAEHLRKNLSHLAQTVVAADTAQSMFDFKAEEVIGQLAPRPVLFMHGADDTVTPVEQSIRMWELAGQPKDLVLITGTDHFPIFGKDSRGRDILKGWMERYFPATPA